MKKTQIFVFIIVVLICIFILLYKFIYDAKSENSNTDVEIVDTILLDNECTYSEGNEDLTKNYIVNGNELSKLNYPYVALLRMGDEIDLYLKDNGYSQQKITIISVADNEPIYKCKCNIGTTGNTVDINYDLLTGTYNFVIYK